MFVGHKDSCCQVFVACLTISEYYQGSERSDYSISKNWMQIGGDNKRF